VPISIADTLSVSISESLSVIQTGLISKSISDTLNIAVSESIALGILDYKTVTDILGIELSEVVSYFEVEIDFFAVIGTLGVGDITIQDAW
jgi:hypothetical protein